MKTIPLLLLGVTASGLYGLKPSPTVQLPEKPATLFSKIPVSSTTSLERPVFFATDAIGGYLGKDKTEILDLVWGIDLEGDIGLAVFKGKRQDGTIVEYSRPQDYQRLAFSTDELTDFYMYNEDRQRFFVSSVDFRIDRHGYLSIRAMSGTLGGGLPFAFLAGEEDNCCGPRTEEDCVPSVLNPCQSPGNCPGPANCACTGMGGCKKVFAAYCGGDCDAQCGGGTKWVCVGPYPNNCHCQAPQ